MAAYIICNMCIHNRDDYKTYARGFMPVFQMYGGTVLAVHDAPAALEGSWPYDRTVLLSFPTREAAEQWYWSPEYQEIAKHRKAATSSNVAVLDSLPVSTQALS
jgi:uncharacterized protein (DUF1330 family)